MQLAFTDGRLICDLTDFRPARPVGTAPVEFSAQISVEAVAMLQAAPSSFYRAVEGDERFTLTIDTVTGRTISGTIRKR